MRFPPKSVFSIFVITGFAFLPAIFLFPMLKAQSWGLNDASMGIFAVFLTAHHGVIA
jgi:predicted permease